MNAFERQKMLEAKRARLELQLGRQAAQAEALTFEMDKTARELENTRMELVMIEIQRTDVSIPFNPGTFIEMDVSANV